MQAKILKQRENGEHDILLLCPSGTTVEFEGGWHEICEDGKILAVWSFIHPIYSYRETFVKMTNREMERINKAYCGMRTCQCGSGLGRMDPVEGEPGNWWVFHDTDETKEMVEEALGQESTGD